MSSLCVFYPRTPAWGPLFETKVLPLPACVPAGQPPSGKSGRKWIFFFQARAHCPCRYWAADLEMLPVRGMVSVTLPAAFCLNFSIPVLNFCFPSCFFYKTSVPIWHLAPHRWAGPCWPLLNDAMKLLIIVATPSVLKASEKVIFFMVSGSFSQTGCAFTTVPRAGRPGVCFRLERCGQELSEPC